MSAAKVVVRRSKSQTAADVDTIPGKEFRQIETLIPDIMENPITNLSHQSPNDQTEIQTNLGTGKSQTHSHPLPNEIQNESTYLRHYGVLGMKWGVRRNRVSSSKGSSKKSSSLKKKISNANNKRKQNSVKNLSDAELKKRIQRLELERRYKSLKSDTKNRGRRIAREILEGSARAIGQEIIRYGVGTGINTIAGRTVIGVNNSKKKKRD